VENAYTEPSFDYDVDLPAELSAVPPSSSCKGMFFATVFERARGVGTPIELCTAAGIEHKRYLPFVDYALTDFCKLTYAAVQVLYRGEKTAQGLRLLSRGYYETFAQTLSGKIIFGVLGRDAQRMMKVGPKAFSVAIPVPGGSVEVEALGATHMRYHFRDYPIMLNHANIGVCEGALAFCGVTGRIRIAKQDLGNASYDIQW
jgi:uncharacterized protein (TIGR02265 family)